MPSIAIALSETNSKFEIRDVMKTNLAVVCLIVAVLAGAGAYSLGLFGRPAQDDADARGSATSNNPFSFGPRPAPKSSSESEPSFATSRDDYSNIHPTDYLGPESCATCHAPEFEQWQSHSHHVMNQNATAESVLGDFDNRHVNYGEGEVVLETQGDRFYMTLLESGEMRRQYRVTRTVGSRHTQMYVGLQVEGPEPEDHHIYTMEGKLPFGYWIDRDLWTPVSYFDSAFEPEPESPTEKWKLLHEHPADIKWELNCLYCHNTYPYQHRLAFGKGTGFAPEDFRYTDEQAKAEWGMLKPEHLVTLGISCESCHFGGREHVENQRKSRYYPSSPTIVLAREATASGDSATGSELMNSLCTQCHCATVNCYPNGAGTWNSREALDLKSGACEQQLRCIDCHSPHQGSDHGGMRTEAEMVERCLSCHTQFRDAGKLTSHTHHDVSSVTCLDCHMPRIVQGLSSVIRTHHIHSPTDREMLKAGVPNACNICHLDKSIAWTANQLNENWNAYVVLSQAWDRVYGDIEGASEASWLRHEQPIVRLIASDAIARNGKDKARQVTALLPLLNDPYAVNRMFGMLALERVLGRQLTPEEYDPVASRAKRAELVNKLRTSIPGASRAAPQ